MRERGQGLILSISSATVNQPLPPLSLCSGCHVGQTAYSRQWVLGQGLSVHSLDGKGVLGDAFLPAAI